MKNFFLGGKMFPCTVLARVQLHQTHISGTSDQAITHVSVRLPFLQHMVIVLLEYDRPLLPQEVICFPPELLSIRTKYRRYLLTKKFKSAVGRVQ